jgi:heme exporter protein A
MQKSFVIDKLCCARQEAVLFSNLSFELDNGNVLLVEGANGSGKSSLLRLLAGLATPASGDILWQGKSILACAAEFNQQLHYVGHDNGLRFDLTVAENLPSATPALLASLQLHKQTHVFARALSAGQKRKIALAKLFLSQKKLWLLDEPLTALDTETQSFFLSGLQQHLQQGGMAVISTHQPISLTMVDDDASRLIHATMQVIRL